MTGPDEAVRRADGCTFRWIRGEIVLQRRDGASARLSGAAAVVWATLDGATPRDEVVRRVEHDWPELGHLAPDTVRDVLSALMDEGLVVAVAPPA